MLFPHAAGLLRILVPPDGIQLPSCRHNIWRSIVIYVDGPLAAVSDKLADCASLAILVALPIASVGPGILVPVRAAQNIEVAISIHIQRRHAFRMIRSQPMREKCNLWQRAGTSARGGLFFRLRQGWRG